MNEDMLILMAIVGLGGLVMALVGYMAFRDSRRRVQQQQALARELGLETTAISAGQIDYKAGGVPFRALTGSGFFQVSRQLPNRIDLMIRRKNVSIRTDMDSRLEDGIETGQSDFDARYTLSARDPALARKLIQGEGFRRDLESIMSLGCTDLRIDGDGLFASHATGISLPALTDQQRRTMIVDMPPLLDQLSAHLPSAEPTVSRRAAAGTGPGLAPGLGSLMFLLLGCLLFIAGAYLYPPMEFAPIAGFSLPFGIGISLVLLVWGLRRTRGRLGAGLQRIMVVLFALPAGPLMGLGMILLINGGLDTAPAREHRLSVLDRTHYPGGTVRGLRTGTIDPSWTLTLPHWERPNATIELKVTEADFNSLPPENAEFDLLLGEGLLGFSWNRSPAEPDPFALF